MSATNRMSPHLSDRMCRQIDRCHAGMCHELALAGIRVGDLASSLDQASAKLRKGGLESRTIRATQVALAVMWSKMSEVMVLKRELDKAMRGDHGNRTWYADPSDFSEAPVGPTDQGKQTPAA